MCKILQVHLSGYYAWMVAPQSAKAKDDQRLLGLLKQAWWKGEPGRQSIRH